MTDVVVVAAADLPADDVDDPSLPEEDRIVFGNKTIEVADELLNVIDAALGRGVMSLPRVPHANALLESLRQAYGRNVDILETYMGRNIFTVAGGATRRREIVEAVLDESKLPEVPAAITDVTNQQPQDEQTEEEEGPKYDKIPSQEDMDQLSQELRTLRTKLNASKRIKNQVVVELESLAQGHASVRVAHDAIQKSGIADDNNKIYSTVATMVMGKDAIDDITQKGKELLEKMKHEKRAPAAAVIQTVPKKQKMDLEEAFEEHKKKINTSGLKNFKTMLSAGK